jgi:hypothetical protein
LEKVSDTSFPRLLCFRGTLQDRFRSDFSPRGTISVILPENSYFQQQSFSHGSTILPTSEFSEFSSRCGSSRSPSHSTSPALSSGTLGLRFSRLGGSSTYSSCLTASPRLVDSQGNVLTGVALLHPVPSLTLYTDSSLQGWGAFLEERSVSGVWSLVQQQEHINLLEMRAVLLELQHFKTLLVSKAVVLATDNTTVMAYLQNQGVTRCHALFLLCKEIRLLCLLSHIHLVVRHIPGTFNVLADCLSRFHNPVNTEWELLQVVFDSVVLRWDRPHVDLFATSLNHKLETFVTPVPDPLAFAVDAMSLSWDGMFAYAFPPLRFLLQVLLKI